MWVVEQAMAWRESFRWAATLYEVRADRYDGFVPLDCAFLAANKLL
jgi:hypothetical protein